MRMSRLGAWGIWVGGIALAAWLGISCGGEQQVERSKNGGTEPVAAPLEIPDDLPRYPGAKVISFDNESFEDGLTASFESPDPAEKIEAFYDEQLPAQGWAIEVAKHLDDGYIIFANKSGVEVNVDVMRGGGMTKIELSLYPHEEE